MPFKGPFFSCRKPLLTQRTLGKWLPVYRQPPPLYLGHERGGAWGGTAGAPRGKESRIRGTGLLVLPYGKESSLARNKTVHPWQAVQYSAIVQPVMGQRPVPLMQGVQMVMLFGPWPLDARRSFRILGVLPSPPVSSWDLLAPELV